jgi:hypothetical protein
MLFVAATITPVNLSPQPALTVLIWHREVPRPDITMESDAELGTLKIGKMHARGFRLPRRVHAA